MIYLTGDTHGSSARFTNPEYRSLTEKDYVIVCGDFGMIFSPEVPDAQETKEFEVLDTLPFQVLFVDGNHENFTRLNSYPVEMWNGGKSHRISNNVRHLMRGQIFTIESRKIFTFGGAESTDKHLRIPNISWWEEEMPSMAEYEEGLDNLEKHGHAVDYILTHDLPAHLVIKFSRYYRANLLHKYLEEVDSSCSFAHWYCGHHHVDMDLTDRHTILFNALVPLGQDILHRLDV